MRAVIVVIVTLVAADRHRCGQRPEEQAALGASHLRSVKKEGRLPAFSARNAVGPAINRAATNSALLWVKKREKRICNSLDHRFKNLAFFVQLSALDSGVKEVRDEVTVISPITSHDGEG